MTTRPAGASPEATSLPRGPAWAIATFLGVGQFPFAPGTVGTFAAIPVYLAAHYLGGPWLVVGLAAAAIVAGVPASTLHARRLGRHDPGAVVIDEVAGYLITMSFVDPTPLTLVAGFFLFRALDVAKPWPASRMEALPDGWGIMADDVFLGIVANLLLQSLRFWT